MPWRRVQWMDCEGVLAAPGQDRRDAVRHDVPDRIDKIHIPVEDRVIAAQGAGDFGLGRRADGADDGGAEMPAWRRRG